MKINVSKEQMKEIGKAGLKIGKAIVIEGTKAVAVKGATAAIMAGFDNGTEGIKNLELDTVLGNKKKDKESKGFFKRKKKEVEIEEIIEVDAEIVEVAEELLSDENVAEVVKED